MRRSVMTAKVIRAGAPHIAPAEDVDVPPRGDFAPQRWHYAGRRMASLRASTFARDAVVALVAFGATLVLLAVGKGATRSLDVGGVALAALATLPLLAHRPAPLGVFVLTAAASAGLAALGYAAGPPFGPTAALFFVATDDRTRDRLAQTAAVVLGMYAVHVGATAIGGEGFPTIALLAGVVVWGGAWIVGDQVRQRRQRVADLEERARRAERETERERRLAAAEERTRIARDLHDSAAHAINVILVQAGAARLLQERDPASARAALATIEEVARETIGDIDQLIHGLREESASPIEPPTGLAALETLAERHRAAGQAIVIRVDGERRPLGPGIDQAAYRILQESLTNAARHGSGEAAVEIAYGEAALEVTVSNRLGANGARHEGGHGILGMRERAALLGGSLDAAHDGDTFRVKATLPYA
jgi:signal transduction histidine kinase